MLSMDIYSHFLMGPFSPSKGYVLETVGMIVHSGAKYEIMTGLD